MRAAVNSSILTSKEFDISDNSVKRVADEVAAWLAATGGLYSE